jgi:hypothetical protein
MVIKASASAEIRVLIEALSGDDDVRREAAVARLAIIGPRAVDRLAAAYESTGDRATRVAILQALTPIGDPRSGAVARKAVTEGGDVAVAGAGVLRALLNSPKASAATDALDALVALALDPAADRLLRLAAFEGFQDLPADVRTSVADALRDDPDQSLRARALTAASDAEETDALWRMATETDKPRLPEDPRRLRNALAARGSTAPLGVLQKLIDAVRGKESDARAASKRQGWQSLRGSLHQTLALRGSRVALYDLREAVDTAAGRLPISFLAALHLVGDSSCLEPLAAAWKRSPPEDEWWRHQLASAFRAITRREKITRRHAVLKRLAARWPDAPFLKSD